MIDLEVFSLGWVGLIIGIFVVVAAGVLYFVLRNKISEYPILKEYKEAKLKLPEINASVQLKEVSLDKIRGELASLQLLNEKNRAEKEQFIEWEKGIKEKYAKLGSQESSIQEMMERRDKAIEQVMEQEKLLNQRIVQLQDAEKQIQEKAEEVKQLEAKSKELEGIGNKLEGRQKELDKLIEKLAQSKEEHQALEAARNTLVESNAKMETEKAFLEESVKALKLELERLEKAKAETEKELGEMQHESARIAKSLKDLEKEEKKNQKLAEEKKAKVESLDGELEKLRKEDSRLEGEINRKKDLLKGYNDDISKREKELSQVMEQLTKSIDKLGEAFKASDNMVEAMVEASGVKLPDVKDRLKDWHRPYFDILQPQEDENWMEISALGNFKKHIRSSGFRFDDRVLDSFHTSLKVSGFSPLTVLAGISGTGKSQLPRLYCEAMGIHFLPLSVQPRWDSPQDLLGFYNYVENRYKATPLSRSLRQFENYGDKDQGGDLKDQMLMVLLDEMNLARVEYYFSDFLSKLENRDSNRESDPKVRSDSELAIEAGPLTEKESKQYRTRVYPGFNVVFVGTMNEDDTTQTLSDKVLDRSNVLRFGRPEKLEVADAIDFNKTKPPPIPFSAWKEWSKNPISEDNPWAAKLSDLNEELERVGRPFGYRVFGGVLSYLGNYPHQDDDGLRKAFADQVEVKIMPKLRGLETRTGANQKVDTLMSKVDDLISETKDQELKEAFNRSREEDFFSFVGVRR